MKIFTEANSPWENKVNFVDSANTVVGYDMAKVCCENAGYYISEDTRSDIDSAKTITEGLEPYTFDRGYFAQIVAGHLQDGGMVRFRLTADGKPDLYLHIFNSHNGYYNHGFTMSANGEQVRSASL